MRYISESLQRRLSPLALTGCLLLASSPIATADISPSPSPVPSPSPDPSPSPTPTAAPQLAAQPSLVERLAYVLTGLPADPADVAAYTSGKKSLNDLANSMRATPAFQNRFADYWLRVLGIQNPVNFLYLIDETYSQPTLLRDYLKRPDGSGQFWLEHNGDCGTPAVPYYELHAVNTPLNPTGLNDDWNVGACTCDTAQAVSPYWSPSQKVLVCPNSLQADICGPSLENCFPFPLSGVTDPSRDYDLKINRLLSREPGLMIAKIVAEDQPFDQVLRTTKGLANGAYLHFLKTFATPHYDNLFPPGSYPNRTASNGPYAAPNLDDTTPQWVERGSAHSGVLTTPAFQLSADGRTAKVHRVMQAFLCRDYVWPLTSVDEQSQETNLARRNNCASCHKDLDAAASFFEHWPRTGDANYFYTPGSNIFADGSFNGVASADVVGFSDIVTNMRDYYSCAVQRSFEFLVGRPMNAQESLQILPKLTDVMLSNNENLWTVMLSIINSPQFNGLNHD